MLFGELTVLVLVFDEHVEQAVFNFALAFFPVFQGKNRRDVFEPYRPSGIRNGSHFAFVLYGRIIIDYDKCTECGLCAEECCGTAIDMVD